jgi:simple sugar transport system substrate-binding protein
MSLVTRRTLLKAGGAAAALPLLGGRAFAQEPLKVGFVYVGPVGDFGYTFAHEQGRKEAQDHFGDKVVTSYVENVAEGPTPSASSATSPRTATSSSSPPPSAS